MAHRNSRPRAGKGRPSHPDILTPAEWRVADAVRHGLTNPQIAKRQGVSFNAVKYHVSNILGKLGMTSRAELRQWPGVASDSQLKGRRIVTQCIEPRAIGQIARTVSDIATARHWYGDILGLPHLFDAGDLAFFECGGVRLMLTQGEAGPESLVYFAIEDLHSAFGALQDRGVKIVSAPHKIHTHEDGSEEWMGFIEDPDGRPIGLMTKGPSQAEDRE